MLGHLEAIEDLLSQGLMTAGPERTVYLCFGHDEEVGGPAGAAKVASLLREYGVRCDFLLDEGLFVVDGCLPQVTRPVALVGTQEKGSVTLEMSVEVEPGHASKPGRRRDRAHGAGREAPGGTPHAGSLRRQRPAAPRGGGRQLPLADAVRLRQPVALRGPLQRISSRRRAPPPWCAPPAVTMFRAGEKATSARDSLGGREPPHSPADSVAAVLAHDEAVLRGDMAWHHYSFAPSFLLLSAAQWACLGWPLAYVAASPALLLAWVLTSLLAVTVPPGWWAGSSVPRGGRRRTSYTAPPSAQGRQECDLSLHKSLRAVAALLDDPRCVRDLRLSTFECSILPALGGTI